jgi:hypothetical protein
MPKYVYTLGRCGQDEGGCVCWLALALYLTDRWSKIPLICPLLCTMYYVLQFPNIQYIYVFLYISKRLYGCSMWVLTWLHYLLIILLSVVRWFVPLKLSPNGVSKIIYTVQEYNVSTSTYWKDKYIQRCFRRNLMLDGFYFMTDLKICYQRESD